MPYELISSTKLDKFSLSFLQSSPADSTHLLSEAEIKNLEEKLTEPFEKDLNETYLEVSTPVKRKPNEIDEVKEQIHSLNIKTFSDISFFLEFRRNDHKVLAFFIRRKTSYNSFFEIRIASAGNVDAGKSTILGVLTHNVMDDGRGSARSKMFKHPHEMETGRTSCANDAIMGFNSHGIPTNLNRSYNKVEWDLVCQDAYKVVNFIDLAGHEKYLKTTIFGLVGLRPDYVMLMVGSNMGLGGMSKEHLGLSLALNIPAFFVVTKIDTCPKDVLKHNLDRLVKVIKSPAVKKKHIHIKTIEDVLVAFVNLSSNMLCPIFQVSCVTGENIDLLKTFISILPQRQRFNSNSPCLFWIDDIYTVQGIGCVVCGILVQGVINRTSKYLLGPFPQGEFVTVSLKSIHRKKNPVDQVVAGQSATMAVKKMHREDIRKGMVMLEGDSSPCAYWQFRADIHVLHHPTTIKVKYQAVVHVGPVKQIATMISMDKEVIRTGDQASVIMEFLLRPEYIVPESAFVFREGRTKAVGTIKELLRPVSISVKSIPSNPPDKKTDILANPNRNQKKKQRS